MSNTTLNPRIVYLKSYHCQYRVWLTGEVKYTIGWYTRFNMTIESKSAILRYEYASGVKGGASVDLFSENPWPNMPIDHNSWNLDGSRPEGYPSI